MTELYINNEFVVLADDIKIKLIFDNPFFMKSAGYTRDIRIPLNNNQNRKVFKSLNRMDVKKNVTYLDATLKVDHKELLKGKAIIREVKEEELTIQLVADNAAFNFLAKGESYIDELDYGEFTNLEYPNIRNALRPDVGLILFGPYDYHLQLENSYIINYLFMPIYNEAAGEVYNKTTGYYFKGVNPGEGFYHEIAYRKFCPQPYLLWVIERVIRAIGYYIDYNALKESPLANVFICNATVTKRLQDTLPHWSVNDFISQVENFFNVVFVVKDYQVDIHFAKDYYTNEAHSISLLDVIDEYTTTINIDEEKDISLNNITYDLANSEVDSYRKIDADVLKGFETVEASTMKELEAQKNALSESIRFRRLYLCKGRYYMLVQQTETDAIGKFMEIDLFRDLIRDKTIDDSINLKIVPVATTIHEVKVVEERTGGRENLIFTFPVLMPSTQGATYERPSRETPTLQEVLNGYNENKITKSDIIEVAINNMTQKDTSYQRFYSEKGDNSIGYPTCFTDYQQEMDGNPLQAKEKTSLRLIPEEGKFSIGSLLENRVKVDKRIEYSFSFISKEIYDSKSIFIIRNQKYVAKNIEVEITDQGINPLQSAVMYRLED